ncbi:MAG: hypothetical protein K6T87_23075 [Roseiflexus sp.]|uniref:hypothetical protein n=1 Tax=Roseiflexus sp. TaxID=2562120 RepID=UPI0025CD6452|nr:hypothetical protein [Roseiflexus sp.]MCL6543438.1 hypothetical protein [Roseiflexus sp.]
MKSQTTLSFWQHYQALPPKIRQRARQVYKAAQHMLPTDRFAHFAGSRLKCGLMKIEK